MQLTSLIICCLFSFTVSATSSFLPNANIVKIHGVAFINKEQVEVGAEIGKGMDIKIPKKNDYIIIKYQNGHKMVLIGANVKVEELTEKISQVNLIKGEVYASVEKLNPEETFVIKTKQADFAVHGTKFGVSILESKKKTYLSVEEGVVTATRKDMSIDVSANEELWSGLDSSVLKAKKAAPLISKKIRVIIKDMQNFN